MDILKILYFEDESVEVIIVDLFFYYFNDEIIKNIIREIKRVLKSDGCLIGRVNFINDLNYGVGSG